MGMVLTLGSLSEATMRRLLADPPLVWQVLAPDDPEPYERARKEERARSAPGFFARLFGARAPEEPAAPPPPLVLTEGEGEIGDLDKSWHGIHYLLTGSSDGTGVPLDFLVAGGADVGDDDVGYGPMRVFTPAETRQIAAALAAVSDDELRSRFDGHAMMRANIYPEIWDRDPADDDTLGYLMAYVTTMREAITATVARGHGLSVHLS
jgi:hypothetical protein